MNPVLSIIIVSFNTADITLNCLKSINQDRELQDIPFEIIVIDNASTDNSVIQLKKNKKIKLIVNKKNLGFAKANNQGIAESQGNYILLLNSDTLIQNGAISQCLKWLSSHPEAAACTAQLLNADGSVQPSGGFFPNLLNTFTWSTNLDDLPLVNYFVKPIHPHSPQFYTHDTFYLRNHTQDWVTGAFVLIRRHLAQTIKLDEDYFMYAEEVEWFYRLKKQYPHLSVHYLIGAQVIHLGGASSPTKLNTITNEYQGIIHFFSKHHGRLSTQLATFMLKVNATLRRILYQLQGNSQLAGIYQTACSKI
ncbi:glycosyltransferase family 2 protein [Patescibacteria group bacterium]|nr:glycosyltransferase family 2 protein [Patescibacteria group bacterium]